jgi:hypothetical protein
MSRVAEYLMRVLDDKLDRAVLGVHVRHLTFQAVVPHDRRCKYHCEILG